MPFVGAGGHRRHRGGGCKPLVLVCARGLGGRRALVKAMAVVMVVEHIRGLLLLLLLLMRRRLVGRRLVRRHVLWMHTRGSLVLLVGVVLVLLVLGQNRKRRL
mmetsp:Transcript_71078/g.189526  ORF Transcript_71078/g.189526 Transcript_71078/m.189526 type:complete len:103 (-) Transcript_71078:482-790(-)